SIRKSRNSRRNTPNLVIPALPRLVQVLKLTFFVARQIALKRFGAPSLKVEISNGQPTKQQTKRPEPKRRCADINLRFQQHELAIALDDEGLHLLVAVARFEPFANEA